MLDVAAVVREVYKAPGLELRVDHNDHTFDTRVSLRYPPQIVTFSVVDSDFAEQAIAQALTQVMGALQDKVRDDLGLRDELREAVQAATDNGRQAGFGSVITEIEKHRSRLDGRLPQGWADVLDLVKGLS